jgi:hypothetical protein
LQSTVIPRIDVVKVQLLPQNPTASTPLIKNDGLIRIEGAKIPCSGRCPSDIVADVLHRSVESM